MVQYCENDLKRMLGGEVPYSPVLDKAFDDAYDQIRKESFNRRKRRNKYVGAVASVACIIFVVGILMSNPVWAKEIPYVGNAIELIRDFLGFKDIPKEEIVKLENKEEAMDNEQILYEAKDEGYTVTITDYYASNQAIFLGIKMESEDGFGELASIENGRNIVLVGTEEKYSFRQEDLYEGSREFEGKLVDDHTMVGLIRIDYESIKVGERKYEIPEELTLDLEMKFFYLYKEDGKETVHGSWKFPELHIVQSEKDVKIVEIGETNEMGIGLESIEISPVEITLHTIEPTDYLVMAVVLDKDGNLLPYAGDNTNELSISGYDTSEIAVYICDYVEYMDHIKGMKEDNNVESFRGILEDKALYKKKVLCQKE